jgi:hypothetical protein
MDFHQLLARMQELDQPVPETQVIEEPNEGNEFSGALAKAKASGAKEFEVDGKKYQVKEDGTVEECPMSPTPMEMNKPDTQPPNMSINLNAQGMDDIAELMKLMTKVNPDMEKPAMPPMPTMGMDPTIASIKPAMPPLKMLPDLDSDNDDMPGGEQDIDKDEPDAEPEMKKDKDEAFGNSMNDSEPETGDVTDVVRDGNDLHKKKDMFKAAAGGDNAMAAESTDLRSQIRAELLRRLEEAKGAK